MVGDLFSVIPQAVSVSVIEYYTPFMLAGSVLLPILAGLMTTVTIHTGLVTVLVWTNFYGFAGGIGFLSPQSAVRMALPKSDANIGLSIILFAEQFGPAVFVLAAQSIFQNRLLGNLQGLMPSLNGTNIKAMGLSDIKSLVVLNNLEDVLAGFYSSLAQTWYLAVALACVTMVGSASMEWKSVKQKQS